MFNKLINSKVSNPFDGEEVLNLLVAVYSKAHGAWICGLNERPGNDAHPNGYARLLVTAVDYGMTKTAGANRYVYDDARPIYVNENGTVDTGRSPQERFVDEINAAALQNFSIGDAITWLFAKGKVKTYRLKDGTEAELIVGQSSSDFRMLKGTVLEQPVLDRETGEVIRDENGIPKKWYDIRFVSPDTPLGRPQKEAPAVNMADEHEAKRARKGKRGYAGNTGED